MHLTHTHHGGLLVRRAQLENRIVEGWAEDDRYKTNHRDSKNALRPSADGVN